MKRWQELALAWTIVLLVAVGLGLTGAAALGFHLPTLYLPTRF